MTKQCVLTLTWVPAVEAFVVHTIGVADYFFEGDYKKCLAFIDGYHRGQGLTHAQVHEATESNKGLIDE